MSTCLRFSLLFALGLSACSPSSDPPPGGGSVGSALSGATSSGALPGPQAPGSPTNQVQWQTALAALAQTPGPDPLDFRAPALVAYNDLIQSAWPHLTSFIRQGVEAQLQAQVGQALQGVSILSLRRVDLDVDALPALGVKGTPPWVRAELHLPQAPGTWSLELEAEVSLQVFGPQGLTLRAPLLIQAQDVRVLQPVELDLSSTTAPSILAMGQPALQMRLVLSSSQPLLQGVLGPLTQILDPVIRGAIILGSRVAQQQLNLLQQQLPQVAGWGKGGPALTPHTGALPLEPLSLSISETIQRDHMPHGNVYPARYDQPHSGGQVTGYRHHGDSALWTGGYLG